MSKGRVGRVLVDEAGIEKIVERTAEWICKECQGDPQILAGEKPLYLLIVLKGAVVYGLKVMEKLHRLGLQVRLEFLRTESYGNGTTSGEIKILLDVQSPIAEQTVFVIEDIVDTGTTLDYLLSILERRHPYYLGVCALLNKPSRRRIDLSRYHIFAGEDIEDLFVVGAGLDWAQRYRANTDIRVVEFDK